MGAALGGAGSDCYPALCPSVRARRSDRQRPVRLHASGMRRSPALDFLRGAAAFAVAVPHYLTTNAPFRPYADAVAVAGVEVFFVLSGFVLAPQIVDWVIGKPWRNLSVFLARRWMRTIPPYVVALIAIALMTGNLLSADFLRYLVYVENLFGAANRIDFYPVAWSFAVEEWFYLLFAPLLFLVGRLVGRSDRRLDAAFAVLVIVAVAGGAVRFRAARLGPRRPPRHALSDRLDRLGLSALPRPREARRAVVEDARRKPALRRARRRSRGRRRARTLGLAACGRRKRGGAAGVSLFVGAVRDGRRRLFPPGGRGLQGPSNRRVQLLARPHLLLGLSLSYPRRHGAEASDRRLADRRAAGALSRHHRELFDAVLARLRAADSRGPAGLWEGAGEANPHPSPLP